MTAGTEEFQEAEAVAQAPPKVLHLTTAERAELGKAARTKVPRSLHAALELASAVCDHLADAHEGLRSLSFDPVTQRLAWVLLGLADRLGEAGARGSRIAHHITQEELARMIGARREVVSGLLNRLRADGLISYTRRGLIEIDREALEAYAESIVEK